MATYKNIKGFNIQSLGSDPPAPFEGEVWYNTSSNTLKYFANVAGVWATGGNMGTAVAYVGSAGTQTAGLSFGGRLPPTTAGTEEYNGSSWTNGGNLTVGRGYIGGAGTQTAGLAFGGVFLPGSPNRTASTEEYNGSSWTNGGSLLNERFGMGGAGTQTAALAFGGAAAPNPAVAEEYNGSSWTTGGTMAQNRRWFRSRRKNSSKY